MKSVIGQFSKAAKGEISDQEVARAKWVMLKMTGGWLTIAILSTPSGELVQGKLSAIFLCLGLSYQLHMDPGVACPAYLVVPGSSAAVPGTTLTPVGSTCL